MFIDILIVTLVLPTPIGVACLLELLWNHKKIFRTIMVYDKLLKINQLIFLKHTVFRKELKYLKSDCFYQIDTETAFNASPQLNSS